MPIPEAPATFGAPRTGKPLSRARFERLASRAIAAFGIVFGLQVIPSLMASLPLMEQPWGYIRAIVVLGSIVWVVIAAVVQRTVRLSAAVASICYVVALISWPETVADVANAPPQPWLWYVCTVATAYAAVAFSPLVAGIYTVVTPTIYGVMHQTPAGGGASVTAAALDAVYAIILGGALLVIITLMRQAASGVDAAQAAALDRYSVVAREHANESERIEVDALVHDSVLTTLLAAAGAHTPEAREVASRMAREAIGHLDRSTGPSTAEDEVLQLDRLAERMASAARSFSSPFAVRFRHVSGVPLPATVADGLHAAAVQAMVNSVQHAGEQAFRSVTVAGAEDKHIEIAVADDGVGFDPATVSSERLGLRMSIRERVSRIGGEVDVQSAPGQGTVIRMRWPAAGAVSGFTDVRLGAEYDGAAGPGSSPAVGDGIADGAGEHARGAAASEPGTEHPPAPDNGGDPR